LYIILIKTKQNKTKQNKTKKKKNKKINKNNYKCYYYFFFIKKKIFIIRNVGNNKLKGDLIIPENKNLENL